MNFKKDELKKAIYQGLLQDLKSKCHPNSKHTQSLITSWKDACLAKNGKITQYIQDIIGQKDITFSVKESSLYNFFRNQIKHHNVTHSTILAVGLYAGVTRLCFLAENLKSFRLCSSQR